MDENNIAISVLMSAYNVEKYIGEAISSVLMQTFKNFEFIIINDGSTDKTQAVIDSFQDNRIVVIRQSNQGIAAALNAGLKIAKGRYIARFDADDICYPNRLEKQYQFATTHTDYIIVGSAVDYMDKDGNYIFSFFPHETNEVIQREKKKPLLFIHSGVLYNRDVIIASGGYNTHAHTFEDSMLWLRALNKGKGHNIQESLLKVRINPESITIDEKWRSKKFHAIKSNALEHSTITEQEGNELAAIIKKQNVKRIKEGAYYSLLAKKYLWNNHQPLKARQNLKKVIALNYFDWKSYFFLLLSYLPSNVLLLFYKLLKPDNKLKLCKSTD